MVIMKLPPKISNLLGKYDKSLREREKEGCLGDTELMCYNRFAEDLERSKEKDYPYYFDTAEVERVLQFASLLTIYDDVGNKASLELYPVQKFIVANLLGWKNKSSKLLRFREMYAQIARRNGKSYLMSILMHFFLTCSRFRSERGICFSVKRDTALIAFRQFCQFIDADSDLADLYHYSKVNGSASSLGTDNYLEVFTGAKNADGFQSGYAIGDELALQDGELYQLIKDGQANLPQAQIVGITTAGFDIGGWCHKHYKALKVQLEARNLPDNLFVFICEPNENDDVGDWHTWCKANPVLFYTQDGKLKQDKIDLYATKYQSAALHGGKELNSWITKQCNLWNAKADTLLCNFDKLEASRYDFTFTDVMAIYKDWYLGIDLAQVQDLNSIAFLTWIYVDADGKLLEGYDKDAQQKLYANVVNFMPSAQLNNHIQTDKFMYNRYVGTELILTVGGKGLRTDYSEIFEYIKNLGEANGLNYVTIACDPYGVATIQSSLEQICTNLIMQSQHRKALSPYIETFGAMVNSDEIALSKGTSDIFMRAVRNSVVAATDDGYLTVSKPTKFCSGNYRIDPVDAIIDGMIAPCIERNRETVNPDEIMDEWKMLYEE